MIHVNKMSLCIFYKKDDGFLQAKGKYNIPKVLTLCLSFKRFHILSVLGLLSYNFIFCSHYSIPFKYAGHRIIIHRKNHPSSELTSHKLKIVKGK